jgi:Cdc6-like AAA superfamily ATPase
VQITMQEWFGLKETHRDFTIETDTDARLFFARHELDERLRAILRRSFRTGTPPKMVLYGGWGVGKTHTMRHLEYVIETNDDFPAVVVFAEMPDVTTKSTFQVAHAALLDALGLARAKQWVIEFQSRYPADAQDRIRDFTQSGDISTAFANLLAIGEGSRIAWDWLRGLAISAGDARLAGLPPSLTQSNAFVRVLQMFGRLAQEVKEKLLVFMLDEATKLGYVSNSDAVNHWTNSLKLLADQQTKEVGFIVSGSWVDPDEMALPLQDQQVVTRFGDPNYIPLHNLDDQDTRNFISALVEEWVDDADRDRLTDEFASEADGEMISAASFPFTEAGLDTAVAYACRQGGYTTPRDIQVALDNLLNRAIDDGRHIVSSVYLGSLINC